MLSENRKIAGFLASAVLILLASQPLLAQVLEEPSQEPETPGPVSHLSFGGPDSVENLLESNRADKDVLFETSTFDSFSDWQAGISEKNGFSFGTGYTSNYFSGSSSLPDMDDYSAGGMLRIFGNWELSGRGTDNTGTLSFKLDQRHSYTDVVPNLYSLDSLGYVDSMASTFSDEGWRLTNLHWRQSWNNVAGGQIMEIIVWICASFMLVTLMNVNAAPMIFFFVLPYSLVWGMLDSEAGHGIANERIAAELIGVVLAGIAVSMRERLALKFSVQR
jgi:hypothetical protein